MRAAGSLSRTAGAPFLAVFAIVVAGAMLPSPAGAHDARAALDAEVALETQLVIRELEQHAQWRRRESAELERAAQLAARLDRLVAEEAPTGRELSRAEEELVAAREMAHAAGERAAELRRSIGARRFRLGLLREALARREPVLRDALSGRWQLHVLPTGQRGIATLRLDGALVAGAYELDGGFRGSLRGTFVGGKLTLERIDAERGFDAVFEARLVGEGRLAGGWRTTGLAGSDYTSGDWSATRLPEPDEEAP